MRTSFYRYRLVSSVVLSALVFASLFSTTQAAGLVQCDESRPESCSLCALFSTVKAVYDFASRITLLLAFVFILFGGYEIIISGAQPARYASGRNHIKNAFLGVFIVLAAWFIVNAFMVALTGGGSIYGVPWQTLRCQ